MTPCSSGRGDCTSPRLHVSTGRDGAPFAVPPYADLATPILESQTKRSGITSHPYLGSLNYWPNELQNERQQLRDLEREYKSTMGEGDEELQAERPIASGSARIKEAIDFDADEVPIASTSQLPASTPGAPSSPSKQREG